MPTVQKECNIFMSLSPCNYTLRNLNDTLSEHEMKFLYKWVEGSLLKAGVGWGGKAGGRVYL